MQYPFHAVLFSFSIPVFHAIPFFMQYFFSFSIPALMAEGFVPPDATLVQPALPLALLRKLLLLQTVTVLRTDSGV